MQQLEIVIEILQHCKKTELQQEAITFDLWYMESHMVLNTAKTKGMLLTAKAKHSRHKTRKKLNVIFQGNQIETVTDKKDERLAEHCVREG